jgi:hypothetical protein
MIMGKDDGYRMMVRFIIYATDMRVDRYTIYPILLRSSNRI